jgi:hypothetical protein
MSHGSLIFTFFCSPWLLSCRQVIDVQTEIEQIWGPLQPALQVMNKIQTELRQTQLDRQRDIWMQMVSLHVWHHYCCVSSVLVSCCHLEQTASTASKISLTVPRILIPFSWILGIMARFGSKVASPKSISNWGGDMPWLRSWSLGVWQCIVWYPEEGGSSFLWNADTQRPNYVSLHHCRL